MSALLHERAATRCLILRCRALHADIRYVMRTRTTPRIRARYTRLREMFRDAASDSVRCAAGAREYARCYDARVMR